MAIPSEYNYQTANPYFGTLTTKTGGMAPKTQSYHQANAQVQGIPNTTPQIVGIPTTEQMELAQGITESGVLGVGNPFQTQKTAYKPDNGELSPVIEGRADEIENCPWEEYYA